jgi:hypothetical protein
MIEIRLIWILFSTGYDCWDEDLDSNQTRTLINSPPVKPIVGYRRVFTNKIGLDGYVDCLKGHLVTKGCTHFLYHINYSDTFSPVAKMALICLFLSMAPMWSWPVCQFDIRILFLHCDLAKEACKEQPLGFIAKGKFGSYVCRLHKVLLKPQIKS